MARKKIQLATDQRPFIMVYQDFLDSELLDNHYQKLVYIYLKKFADSKNQCYPSVKKLSKLTKISVHKIKITLAELEDKGIIAKKNRTRPDGGKSSNLYTLYDFKELWNAGSSEEMAAVVNEYEEMKLVSELRSRGYTVTKEKELVSTEPTKVTVETSTKQFKQFDIVNTSINTTTNSGESQDLVRYTLDQIKQLFDYDIMIADHSERKTDIDIVFTILYDALNWAKPTIRVDGQDKPSMVVISKLMKLEQSDLWYTIEKYHEQQERIKNVNAYLLTILYHAKEQSYLDLMNLGHHNGDF